MKTPPLAASFVRIGVGLLLCAACFQAGRSYQELSAGAEAQKNPDTEMVIASFVGPIQASLVMAETSPTAAPGDPAGHVGDVITPLNVRDPSALVMGPGDYHPTCPPLENSEAKSLEPKPRKMKEGRLLELLKKADKASPGPKRY